MERHQDRPERASRHRAPNAEAAGNNPAALEAQLINEAIVNPTLTPLPTVSRWTEESTIFGGGMSSSERISLLSKRVAAMLRPEKERKQEEARQKSLAEQQEASAGWEGAQQGQDPAGAKMEEDTKPALQDAPSREATLAAPQADLHFSESASPQAEGSSTTPATPQTPVTQQSSASTSERPSWRERLERRRQAQGNAPGTSQTPSSANARSAPPTQEDLTEVMNLAARLSAVAPAPVAPGILSASSSQIASSTNDAILSDDSAPNESRSEDVQMEGTEEADLIENPVPVEREATAAPTSNQAEQEPQSGPSNNVPRVTIEIHGSTVDITDTGIDPTFLEALPDDMREE
jgi:E3 ubiquitin-protein ligase HUWE1